MLKSAIANTVAACIARPWLVIAAWIVLAIAGAVYTAQNFAINTDIGKLISSEVPWQQREAAYRHAFPSQSESILAVVDAPTPEQVTQATALLTQRLKDKNALYNSVVQMGANPFFARNGFLFMSKDELQGLSQQLTTGAPLLQLLVNDPSLRGVIDALTFATLGIEKGRVTLDGFAPTLTMGAKTIEDVLAGRPAAFSWQTLMRGGVLTPSDTRSFIEIAPKLDFEALEPGKAASDAIRQAAVDLGLAEKFGARVRLTGAIAIADEEFATLREGAVANGIGTVLIVLVILWLALRSGRIILAVFINLAVGLAVTAALGLLMVGTLNLISIAFAVLFVGLGVDFGIQYAVRYRAERYERNDTPDALRRALIASAKRAGPQLTLAAGAVAAGFLSFLPTAYRGVSELGLIAGVGMMVAFVTSVTILPALLMVFNPPGERKEVGYRNLAPVDAFLDRNRIPVLVGTALVVVAGLPLLFFLRFDFNPMNLRNPHVESIATYLELRQDPMTSGNGIQVLARSQKEAADIAKRLAALPEVAQVQTLHSFVPDDQQAKLVIIADLKKEIGPKIEPQPPEPPTDAENIDALKEGAAALTKLSAGKTGPGADAAKHLAADFLTLAQASPAQRNHAQAAFVVPLQMAFQGLRGALQAHPITAENLPPELVREWVAPDGRLRVEAQPKGDTNENDVLRSFAQAVQAVEPLAVGGPIAILESGHTIVSAFLQAGLWAILSIAILLWVVLRRIGDVLLTLVPLLVAGVVTLEITVLLGLPLNFANIIALPLLLGLGVAFKIYYIMAWRSGQTNLLQTSLTRAVIYSAMTTATAFGSLWLSSHPGTSSMGELLALSLLTTLAAAVLFQPVLMGKPREVAAPVAAPPARKEAPRTESLREETLS